MRGYEFVGVVLHVLEHLVGGVALDDLLDPPAAAVLQPDVHHVGVAEQVVQIAQRLLVGADQEGRQVIRLARDEFVHFKRAFGERGDARSGRSCRPSRR